MTRRIHGPAPGRDGLGSAPLASDDGRRDPILGRPAAPEPSSRRSIARTLFLALWALVLSPIVLAQGTPARPASPSAPSVLLVVDAQVGVLGPAWDADRVIDRLGRLVARARAAQVPVVWVQHQDDELKPGSGAWQLVPGLVPAAGEAIVPKRFNSSFAGTDLDARLKSMGVRRVVLAGAATNGCIRATAYAAVDRGYDLTLVADAHTTEPIRLPDGRVVPAEFLVVDLNTVFGWLAAPDVRIDVTPTDAVSF